MAKNENVSVSVTTDSGNGLRFDSQKNANVNTVLGFWLSKLNRNDNKVWQRRAVPIMAYVGANGSGKTAMMVRDTLPSLKAGRTVYSTVPLYLGDELHPCYRPFTWNALLTATHADFLLDEVIGIASSRESSAMTAEVQARLNQLRKVDIVLRWSAPAWQRADKIIREVTQAVSECRGFLPDKSATKIKKGEEKDPSQLALWAPCRLFRISTYDTREFDEWTSGKKDRSEPDVREWYWGVGSEAFAAYRTLDEVQRLEMHDQTKCDTCGHKMRTEFCKGH